MKVYSAQKLMTINQTIEHFNKEIKKAENFLFLARSSKLQLEQCLILDNLLYNASRFKHDAIHRKQEDVANLLLGFECIIGAVRSELIMWVLLKQDLPNEAWNCLIAAQMAYSDAIRTHIGFAYCIDIYARLEEFEKTIFPPQSFMSAGFISDRLDCSICGERYSNCAHLLSKVYMGKFCEVIHRNIRADHVALVDVPADKRCRVVSFKTSNGYRDKLSWEVEPYKDGKLFKKNETLETKSIVMVLERYPYLKSTEDTLGSEFLAMKLK